MPLVASSQMKTLIRFEREVKATGVKSAGKSTWTKVAEVRAQVLDVLPSRSESSAGGISIGARPCRIRCRHRADVDGGARVRIGQRVLQIVSGPAAIDGGRNMELMAQEYTTAGNAG